MLDNLKKTTMSFRKAVIHSFYKSGSSRLETCRDDSSLLRSTVRGFTLIELLVVVLIIGILASVALPQYNLAVAKSRYTQLMVAGDALVKSYQLYYMEHGENPTEMAQLDVLPGSIDASSSTRVNMSANEWCKFNGTNPEFVCDTLYARNLPFWLYYWPTHLNAPENIRGKRVCRARNEFQDKICKTSGGVFSYQLANGDNNYILP